MEDFKGFGKQLIVLGFGVESELVPRPKLYFEERKRARQNAATKKTGQIKDSYTFVEDACKDISLANANYVRNYEHNNQIAKLRNSSTAQAKVAEKPLLRSSPLEITDTSQLAIPPIQNTNSTSFSTYSSLLENADETPSEFQSRQQEESSNIEEG